MFEHQKIARVAAYPPHSNSHEPKQTVSLLAVFSSPARELVSTQSLSILREAKRVTEAWLGKGPRLSSSQAAARHLDRAEPDRLDAREPSVPKAAAQGEERWRGGPLQVEIYEW